jgi:hypothetical protein
MSLRTIRERHRPLKPSEMTVEESAVEGYRRWITGDKETPLLLVGKAGVGKSSLVSLFSKVYNYREVRITCLMKKEESAGAIESLSAASKTDIKRRKLLLVVSDVEDAGISRKVAEFSRKSSIPLVVIADEITRGLREISESSTVLQCRTDGARLRRRVMDIGEKEGVRVGKMEEDTIGRALSRLEMARYLDAPQGKSQGKTSLLNALFYSPSMKRMGLEEIDSLSPKGDASPILSLFTNYRKKCLSLRDALLVSEANALHEEAHSLLHGGFHGEMRALLSLCLFKYHVLFCNDLFVQFESATQMAPRDFSSPFIKRSFFYLYIDPTLMHFERNRGQALGERALAYLHSLISFGICEGRVEQILRECSKKERSVEADPRYIYKGGHSCYVLRRVRLSDLLGV